MKQHKLSALHTLHIHCTAKQKKRRFMLFIYSTIWCFSTSIGMRAQTYTSHNKMAMYALRPLHTQRHASRYVHFVELLTIERAATRRYRSPIKIKKQISKNFALQKQKNGNCFPSSNPHPFMHDANWPGEITTNDWLTLIADHYTCCSGSPNGKQHIFAKFMTEFTVYAHRVQHTERVWLPSRCTHGMAYNDVV